MHLAKLRAICLALPGTQEVHVDAWGHPTFRVGEKIFATWGGGGTHESMGAKTTKEHQAELVRDPRFRVADYVGRHGWIEMKLEDPVDWDLVRSLVHGSYRLIAPKRLARLVTT